MAETWNNPVIKKEAEALMALTNELEAPFERAVSIVVKAEGRIICTGIGKSGHIASKVAATATSIGSPALFMHPTEAAHGSLGLISRGDVLLAFSRSGRAPELVPMFKHAHGLGIPIIMISENDQDSLASYASVILKLPAIESSWGHAPTTSTILQMAIGDAIAVTVAERKELLETAKTLELATKEPFQV